MHTPPGFEPAHVLPANLPGDAYAFSFRGDRILVFARDDETYRIPAHDELAHLSLGGAPHFLGLLGDIACIALDLADEAAEPAGLRYVGLRTLFLKVPDPLLALAARAFQVVDFHRTHRYCGRCGTPTRDKDGERAKECPACGLVVYPRVSPAMMALVTRGREILLARSHRFATGMFSALAGFVEPGETLEEAVRREVHEEAGIRCGRVRYLAAQPWPFPSSLMMGFLAEALTEEITVDPEEIAEARWFHREEMREMVARAATGPDDPTRVSLPAPIAIAHHICRRWATGLDDI